MTGTMFFVTGTAIIFIATILFAVLEYILKKKKSDLRERVYQIYPEGM